MLKRSHYKTLAQRVKTTDTIIKGILDRALHKDKVCFIKHKHSTTNDIRRDLLNTNTNTPIFPLIKPLSAKDTLDSETWITCLYSTLNNKKELTCDNSKKNLYFAVKVMPMTLHEYEAFNEPNEKNPLYSYKIWKEFIVLYVCSRLFDQYGSIPNLPITYSYSICENQDPKNFTNKNILREIEARRDIDEYGKRILVLYSELADNNIHMWLLQKLKNHDSDFKMHLDNALFGILVGLVSLELNIKLVHFDLHLGNVLMIEGLSYKENEFYKYTYKNHVFYVPNIGTMAYVWDFSLSGMNKNTDAFFIRNMIRYGKRFIDKNLFTSKSEILAKNIIDHGHPEYLYSYDTFRLVNGLYDTINRYAASLNNSNDSIEDILDDLYDIREDARDDLTKSLLRVSRGAVKHRGRPLDVLIKRFKKWNKLPKNGKIIKEFKIDLLVDLK